MDGERVADPQQLTIDFDGRQIPCRPGMSLAAVLAEAGVTELRQGADGMRGLFCGMGVCQECRVTVDGRHGVRACMFKVSHAHSVSTDPSRPEPQPPVGEYKPGEHRVETPDVLVIGGGAGGLTAASVAAEAGADTVLLDERPVPGGQYFKQPHAGDAVPESLRGDLQIAGGAALIERARRTGVRIVPGAEVWGAFSPPEFGVFDGVASAVYRPKKTIVATGAYERGLPLPGWTLPGVMTTGAAQVLLRSYGVLAGKRVLIAGNGPLNLQVALELKRAGCDVPAVLELAAAPGPRSILDAAMMLVTAPRLTMSGCRYLYGLRASGVPVRFRHGLAAVEKTEQGLVARIGTVRDDGIDVTSSVAADVICMGYGFQPSNEILRGLGCRHRFDPSRGQLVSERDAHCETTVPGVFAVGDCCGLGGAPAAQDEGTIAACAVVRALGGTLPVRLVRQEKLARRDLRRHRRFQAALWRLFAAPRFDDELATDDTLICRCEGVTLAGLRAALEADGTSIGTAKRSTRLGMGACQGRYCAPIAAAMIARRDGRPLDEYSLFAPRPPIKPIRIDDILNSQ